MSSWDEEKWEAGLKAQLDEQDYQGNWEVSKVRCKCGSRHVSVHPAICTRLECPKCHKWIRL